MYADLHMIGKSKELLLLIIVFVELFAMYRFGSM